MKDEVKVTDRLELAGGGKRLVVDPSGKERVFIEGYFSCVCRERGKIVPGTHREGKNIWTLTGREFLAQLMSYQAYGVPGTPWRNDRIKYIGFGIGAQEEVSSVTQVKNPIPVDGSGVLLAQLYLPTFPLAPARTVVQYARTFSELELSVLGTVLLTEAGLFTDGDPSASWAPGTRNLLSAAYPMGYKSFEPFKKTQNFVLDSAWQVRF